MKIIALSFLLAISWHIGFAQSRQKMDSLRHELAIAKYDTSRVGLMATLADSYRVSNPDSALLYAEKAVDLAKKINFISGEIWATAVNGAVLHDLGNLPKALEMEFKALKMAEETQLEHLKGGPIIFIGRIYFTLKDFPKALYYGRREKAIFDATANKTGQVYALNNLAVIFEQINQLDSALYYLHESEKKSSHVSGLSGRQGVDRTYGNVYFKLGNYPLALNYYRKSLEASFKNNNHQNTSRIFIQIAQLFQKQNQLDSSIFYAKRGLAEAQLVSNMKLMYENSRLLSELYDKKEPKEALHYYKLAITAKDSLFGAGNIQAMQAMIAREENRQKELENEKIAYQNQLKQYGLLAGLGVMLLIGFMLYRNNRQKHKANKVLKNTLTDLKTAQVQLENKNRELEIESALERVRSRSLAMQHSDELQEVITLVFHQLNQINIIIDGAAIIGLSTENANEFVHWTVNPNQTLEATCFKVPYLDHPFTNAIYKAMEEEVDFVIQSMTFDEKNEYFKQLFTHTDYQYLPEETKQIMYEAESYTLYIAFEKYTCLMLDSYLGKIYSEQDINILKRFARIFDQAYTRFLDIQRAEAQTREAQIEVALERVRSRTMAMFKSDELAEVSTLLFQQISQLGGLFDRFVIGIIDESKGIINIWATDQSGNQLNRYFIARLDEKTTFIKVYTGWKAGDRSKVIDLQGEELGEWIKYAREELGIQINEEQLHGRRLQNVAYFSQGYLAIQSSESLAPEIHVILERFANVFNLTYTRFLDLQKAEAQLREAQIEAALENVRSRSLAMQKSAELRNVVSAVVERMIAIGLNVASANIVLLDEHSKDLVFWTKTNKDDIYSKGFSVPYNNDPAVADFFDAFERRANLFTKNYTFEEKNALWKSLFERSDFRDVPAERKKFILEATHFSLSLACRRNTGILLTRYIKEPFSETDNEILKRFANVFEQAYTRFLDLQKAEINEHEAIRQASLDRVRAEIASMRTRNDLQRITPLIWKELTTLTVPFIRCGVFIMDEATEKVHTYLSTPDGQAIASFDLPYASPGITPEVVTHWRNRQRFSDHWDEAQFRAWSQSLVEQGLVQSGENYVSEAPPQQLSLYFLPFRQGMLYVGNGTPLTYDEIQLAQVLADAFSTAYARYQDFNELEETKLQVEKAFAELKSTQTQLIQKEKMASLGELTAGIAHEIQNPLNFVNNFSELSVELVEELKVERSKVKEERDEALENELLSDLAQNQEKINLHGKRASNIVKGMLEHSRQSVGERTLTDINQLADEYLRLAYHGLRAKDKAFNATLETDFDKNLPKIEVIPQDIGRVLLNVINNAFYAVQGQGKRKTEQGILDYQPTVTLSTKSQKDQIIIGVKDNGTGMTEATKSKIFQPFFTTKPTGEGTGLGLSLAYDIVNKGHSGTIEVESVEGKGATFLVKLPIV